MCAEDAEGHMLILSRKIQFWHVMDKCESSVLCFWWKVSLLV